jgi:hypothetical protein
MFLELLAVCTPSLQSLSDFGGFFFENLFDAKHLGLLIQQLHDINPYKNYLVFHNFFQTLFC